MEQHFDISVVIGTYNRAHLLSEAIESLIAQQADGLRYEVIVVDNNSSDNTREVVSSFEGLEIPIRYVFESRQGISYARNAGLSQCRSPIVAFTDDDVRASSNWISLIKKTFAEHPEVGFIGGKVLPLWQATPPGWLTRQHWMPLAIQDHGDDELYLEPARMTGLVAANLSVRRELFDRVGLFLPELQLVKDGIGAMEDHEFIDRMWKAGVKGLYVPNLVVNAPVDLKRTTKGYHRRWHRGHGRSYAIYREERMERASWHLLGVPAHLYRQAIMDSLELLKNWVRRQDGPTFKSEVQLWFFLGFWWKRVQDIRSDARNHKQPEASLPIQP